MKRFINFIEDNDLIKNGDKIIVGLSGGPDSICLLHILNEIKDEYNLQLIAAHVNHMIRGIEADEDEKYCREFCENLNIEFYSIHKKVEEYAKEQGISSEMAGREIRYVFFEKLLKEKGFDKIATAHNANDQAETILMRIMRGTALEGLCGIPVKRNNIYIRPILFMNREEIESYCEKHHLKPRIDKTNLERLYSRNKVRLDILPYMKKNFNEDIIETINRMSTLLQYDNEFIINYSNDKYNEYCKVKNGEGKIQKELFKLDTAIITRVIKRVLVETSKNHNNFEMKHIFDVIELQKMGTNKRIDLPNNIFAENIYGDIYIKYKRTEKVLENSLKQEIILKKNDLRVGRKVSFGEYIINFEVIKNTKNKKIGYNEFIKYFNYDKINDNITIRKRKNGDKIIPLGMSGRKKLKDIFIDMKIPVEKRDQIPIVDFDGEVAWVVGAKVSETFKITKEVDEILKISFVRKEIQDERRH